MYYNNYEIFRITDQGKKLVYKNEDSIQYISYSDKECLAVAAKNYIKILNESFEEEFRIHTKSKVLDFKILENYVITLEETSSITSRFSYVARIYESSISSFFHFLE